MSTRRNVSKRKEVHEASDFAFTNSISRSSAALSSFAWAAVLQRIRYGVDWPSSWPMNDTTLSATDALRPVYRMKFCTRAFSQTREPNEDEEETYDGDLPRAAIPQKHTPRLSLLVLLEPQDTCKSPIELVPKSCIAASTRDIPTPMSPHCAFPSLSFVILYTLLLTSCVVTSCSSPSPSKSCTDVPAGKLAGSGAGVPSPEDPSSASLFSSVLLGAGFGAPNAKGRDFTGPSALSASGVLGGLPKPKPTGLPMLPALGKPPKKELPLLGDADPNENAEDAAGEVFSGVLVTNGFDPEVLEPKNMLPLEEEAEGAGAGSFSSDLSASLALALAAGWKLLKRTFSTPDADAGNEVWLKNEGVEDVVDVSGFENKEEPDVDVPNENGAGAVELVVEENEDGLNENDDFGGSEAAGSNPAGLEAEKLNGLPSELELPESTLGVNPAPDDELVVAEDDARGLKPEKPLGGAGIVNEGVEAGGLAEPSAGFGADPRDVDAFAGASEEVFGFSESTVTRSAL